MRKADFLALIGKPPETAILHQPILRHHRAWMQPEYWRLAPFSDVEELTQSWDVGEVRCALYIRGAHPATPALAPDTDWDDCIRLLFGASAIPPTWDGAEEYRECRIECLRHFAGRFWPRSVQRATVYAATSALVRLERSAKSDRWLVSVVQTVLGLRPPIVRIPTMSDLPGLRIVITDLATSSGGGAA